MALLYHPTYLSIHDLTGEESKPLVHPEGDYHVLNERISYLEHLIEQHCPGKKSEINISFNEKDNEFCLRVPSFDASSNFICRFNIKDFFYESTVHTKYICYAVDFLVDYLEFKYLAHPLRNNNRIFYDKTLQTGETDYVSHDFKKPHGEFVESIAQIKQTFELLELLPYHSSIHIHYYEERYYEQCFFTATIQNKEGKSIAQTGSITLFDIKESEHFHTDATLMDKYMAQLYQKLNTCIAQCEEYKYYKAKLDLYNSLDEHIENLTEPDENSMPKVKI
jgi:hypothetical protein